MLTKDAIYYAHRLMLLSLVSSCALVFHLYSKLIVFLSYTSILQDHAEY